MSTEAIAVLHEVNARFLARLKQAMADVGPMRPAQMLDDGSDDVYMDWYEAAPAAAAQPAVTITAVQPKECTDCTDAARCSRIGQCLAHNCRFGEASPP